MKYKSSIRIPAIIALLCLCSGLIAQEASRADLVAGLQAGGKVILMRHASSPRELPDADSASQGNTYLERQLDAQGREDAIRLGEALRRLDIAIDQVGSSPAFRAMETVEYAGFENVHTYPQLSNESMRTTSQAKSQWLRIRVSIPAVNGNLLLITHGPNISDAFPDVGRTSEGEALIFDPKVSKTEPVGRIAISEWSDL